MAVTSKQIIDFLLANPGMSDAEIVTAMETYGVSPAQMAQAVGVPVGDVISRAAATVPQGQTITLGDTRIAPQYDVRGSGEDQQIGAITNILVEKTTGDVNYKAPVGSEVQVLNPTGEFVDTIKTQKVGGLKEALKDPYVLAFLAIATGGASGLFSGAGTAATVGSTGLTMAELAQLDLALGGAGGTAGALNIAGLAGGTGAGTLFESLNAGAGAGTDYLGGSLTNVGTAGTVANTGLTLSELSQLDLALGGAGGTTGALTLAESLSGLAAGTLTGGLLTSGGTGTTVATGTATGTGAGTATGTAAGTGVATGVGTGVGTGTGTGVGTGLGTTLAGAGTGVGTGLGTTLAGVGTGVATGLGTAAATGLGGLTASTIGALLSGGLTTGAGLLQQQTSREAAIKAQGMIDRETAAAKAAAQFKPIGMTTRFGASQFGFDPVTGQLTSAGYTLSPEAKNAQDRFVKLAESGLVQAEGAQKAFEPLQTGAQSLFKLGQGYLAEKPETVAENYLKSQMALLQPGRELELANLQTKLRNQGRIGLSVAQGGNLGATTPELQALYNARATQEAQLAANAQQYGQQNVLFGAGLLGQGSQAMGQYYGGQQAAYAPYTTAMGQVTGLETAAQQPFQMGLDLGKIRASTGFDIGRLGLQGAGQSVALATGPAATTNPYATLLSGLGASPAFGQALGGLFS